MAEKELRRTRWEVRDRNLFFELVYGTVRYHGRLQWLLDHLGTSKGEVDPAAKAAAAMGLYQLLYLDRIPDHALVDGSVAAARRIGGEGITGWVNAVLRRAVRETESWQLAAPEPSPRAMAAHLATLHSHPEWMVQRWLSAIKKEELEPFLAWNNRRPKITLRANKQVTDADQLTADFEAEGVHVERPPIPSDFLSINHVGDPTDIEAVKTGKASVQDYSQGLVAPLLAPKAGELILDLCAAPGGKTGHLAELAPDARIVATDKTVERLPLLKNLAVRNGYKNVEVLPYDDVIETKEMFDAILLDVPCSGTGVLARRPDLRWRRTSEDIRRMAAVQLNLLRYAAGRLKPGGRIIYSTCSVEVEENAALVEQFLSDRHDFSEESVKEFIPEGIESTGRLQLLGPEVGSDGVFATKLVRRD